jgi:hypothetical protein
MDRVNEVTAVNRALQLQLEAALGGDGVLGPLAQGLMAGLGGSSSPIPVPASAPQGPMTGLGGSSSPLPADLIPPSTELPTPAEEDQYREMESWLDAVMRPSQEGVA